jgi:hypothetical protein
MPISNQDNIRQHWTTGRGFASKDPERQGEVVGYVRSIETSAPLFSAVPRAPRATRSDWTRVQPDRDTSNFEGSSSRRGR